MKFIRAVQQLKATGLNTATLNYLFRHLDQTGDNNPALTDILQLASSIRAIQLAIDENYNSDEKIKDYFVAIYGVEITDLLYISLEERALESKTFKVNYTQEQENLEDEIANIDARLVYASADGQLSFLGIMKEATREAYLAATSDENLTAAITNLYDQGQSQLAQFYSLYPATIFKVDYIHEQENLEDEIANIDPRLVYASADEQLSFSGIMKEATKEAYLAATSDENLIVAITNLYDQGQSHLAQIYGLYPALERVYGDLAAATTVAESKTIINAHLQDLLVEPKTQAIEAFLATPLGLDATQLHQLINHTLSDGQPLLHSHSDSSKVTMQDYLALNHSAYAMRYSNSDGAKTNFIQIPNIAFKEGIMVHYQAGMLPDDNPTTVQWQFYLESPMDGYCNFCLESDAINVKIEIDGSSISLMDENGIWKNESAIPLVIGQFYKIDITLDDISDTPVEKAILKWQRTGEGNAIQSIPSALIYVPQNITDLHLSYLKLLKTQVWRESLGLDIDELIYFAERDVAAENTPFLNLLPTSLVEITDLNITLSNKLKDILAYLSLKSRLELESTDLLTILNNPLATDEEERLLLLTKTNWAPLDVESLILHFDDVPEDFAHDLYAFERLAKALQLSNDIGATAEQLIEWASNNPTATIINNFHAFLKSKYDEQSWLDVLQPINDRMRALQRDALVNYVLKVLRSNTETEHINTPDKLFEYFLIDVQMEACMKTSRIKQAISSVQLFVDHCFMNVETKVKPESLDSKEWEWMSRYRLWEVALKIFLHCENHLDGELRSTKSPFYQEFEGELLQADINDDLARAALLNYLEKLDRVAWLEISG
ncbi:MAG: neuraminidase-like domain-containing protein, partial [Bacteroidota bacterium]